MTTRSIFWVWWHRDTKDTNPSKDLLFYSDPFQFILVYSRLFSSILVYSRLFSTILVYFLSSSLSIPLQTCVSVLYFFPSLFFSFLLFPDPHLEKRCVRGKQYDERRIYKFFRRSSLCNNTIKKTQNVTLNNDILPSFSQSSFIYIFSFHCSSLYESCKSSATNVETTSTHT